mmetsp:Transcript_34266/g.24769  ORF Transcript_34266/g.24769 Transcript_34266/m.24769 type:complete len:95 (+) Transcript_34266:421-705(+)
MEEAKKVMPPVIKYLGDKQFLGGDEPCYVDFLLFELIENLVFVSDGKPFEHENVKNYHARVSALPKLAEYIQSGAEQAKAFSGRPAKINNKDPK